MPAVGGRAGRGGQCAYRLQAKVRARCDQSRGSAAVPTAGPISSAMMSDAINSTNPPEDDAQRGWVDECYEAPADQWHRSRPRR